MGKLMILTTPEEGLPKEEGEYITNFGKLPYREGKFWLNKHPTVIEYWLSDQLPAEKAINQEKR